MLTLQWGAGFAAETASVTGWVDLLADEDDMEYVIYQSESSALRRTIELFVRNSDGTGADADGAAVKLSWSGLQSDLTTPGETTATNSLVRVAGGLHTLEIDTGELAVTVGKIRARLPAATYLEATARVEVTADSPYTPGLTVADVQSGAEDAVDSKGVALTSDVASAQSAIQSDIADVQTAADAILVDTGTSGVLVDDSTPVEVNVKKINDVTLTGDGSATPFI